MAHVSPGVYVRIFDLSEYVQNVPSTIGFLALVCEKGPDNELVFTNARDFYKDFGEPNILYGGKQFGQGPYVASAFLQNSDALYVIRVMPSGELVDGTACVAATYSNLILYGEDSSNYGIDGTSTLTADSELGLSSEAEVKTVINFDEDEDDGQTAAVMFYGLGRGAWYNNFKISVLPHANPTRAAEGVYVLDIFQRQNAMDYDTTSQTWVESFEIVQTFEVSFDPTKLDASGESMFIADIVNVYFRDIAVLANRTLCLEMCDSGTDWSEPFDNGPIRLSEGTDGSISDPDVATELLVSAYYGTLPRVRGLSTGAPDENGDNVPPVPLSQYVDEVLDTEDHYFTIVWDAGYPRDVKDAIVYLASVGRADCVAILDNGDNKRYADAITSRLNVHTYNTFYAALYECYTKVYDRFAGRDIWISPVYHMASVIPYTDNVAELWYAPAGFNRGTLNGIKAMRFSPRLTERDELYINQINPIVKFNVGFTVWGQLTTQRRPSALQDLNIVRLVLYIKRALSQFCKFYIFEMNDQVTWAAISSNIDKFLKVIQDKRGLYGYSVSVGATAYEIKAKQIHVDVTLNPTRVVEQIYLNFYII